MNISQAERLSGEINHQARSLLNIKERLESVAIDAEDVFHELNQYIDTFDDNTALYGQVNIARMERKGASVREESSVQQQLSHVLRQAPDRPIDLATLESDLELVLVNVRRLRRYCSLSLSPRQMNDLVVYQDQAKFLKEENQRLKQMLESSKGQS